MTDVGAKMWPENLLKEIYFTPQNKKEEGLGMWYIGNVLTTVVYIFWCKLREKC